MASWQGIEKKECDHLSGILLAQHSLEVRARYMTLGWACVCLSVFLIIMVCRAFSKSISMLFYPLYASTSLSIMASLHLLLCLSLSVVASTIPMLVNLGCQLDKIYNRLKDILLGMAV